MRPVLGIDINGVIIGQADKEIMQSKSGWAHLFIPAVEGSFQAISALADRFFRDRIYLVSRARGDAKKRRLDWLEKHEFYRQTGTKTENVLFCADRVPKIAICQRLGITHFIDNRVRVLEALTGVTNRYLFLPGDPETGTVASPPGIIDVRSWPEIVRKILGT
jgi:hypothetical protein